MPEHNIPEINLKLNTVSVKGKSTSLTVRHYFYGKSIWSKLKTFYSWVRWHNKQTWNQYLDSPVTYYREDIKELNKQYGIDVEVELTRILTEEILKATRPDLEMTKKFGFNLEREEVIMTIPTRCKYVYKFENSQWLESIDNYEYFGIDYDSLRQGVIDSLVSEFRMSLNNAVFGTPNGKNFRNDYGEKK